MREPLLGPSGRAPPPLQKPPRRSREALQLAAHLLAQRRDLLGEQPFEQLAQGLRIERPARTGRSRLGRFGGRLDGPRDQVQRAQNRRNLDGLERLWQHAERTERARLADVELAFLRGVHHHRNRRGGRVLLDRLERLEAVDARHVVVEEDDVGAAVLEVVQRDLGGFSHVRGHAVVREEPAQHGSRETRVVDYQRSLHQLPAALRGGGRRPSARPGPQRLSKGACAPNVRGVAISVNGRLLQDRAWDLGRAVLSRPSMVSSRPWTTTGFTRCASNPAWRERLRSSSRP